MKKEIYSIEYPLNNASGNLLWTVIGTPLGLSEWFSDGVTVQGDEYTFSWDEHEQTATLLQIKFGKFIRFQWLEDKDTDYYFQFEIDTHILTGDVTLTVIDFATSDDINDAKLLWDNQIDEMKRKNGI